MDLKVQTNQYRPTFQAQVKQTKRFKKLGPASEHIFKRFEEELRNVGDDSIKVTLKGRDKTVYVDMRKKHGLFNADYRSWNFDYDKLNASNNDRYVQSSLYILKLIINDM